MSTLMLPGRQAVPFWRAAAACALALVLGACGTLGGSGPRPPAAGAHPADAGVMTTERRWLQQWFADTPVVITQRDDGPVSVTVPRQFCFDAGRTSVKPALAAVLDKVAESLRRTPSARVALLAAPGDTPDPSPLALQRATRLRAHLQMRGARHDQLGEGTATTSAAVLLRLELAAR